MVEHQPYVPKELIKVTLIALKHVKTDKKIRCMTGRKQP